MTTIEVIVTGGIAPIPIKVVIDNLNNNEDLTFKREFSFKEKFDLTTGEYLITITGMNPSDGTTEMRVSGTFDDGPDPADHHIVSTRFYSKFFYIKL
jgi:hypothetical protein